MKRKLTTLGMAAIMPVILVSAITLTGGTAFAKKGPPATITCDSLTTTISWNPPLVPGPETSKTTQISFAGTTISGCTTDPASGVTQAASVTATASLTKHGNSCNSLIISSGKPTKYTFVVNWQGGGSSKVIFKGSSTTSTPSLGFTLSNGKATGAYVSKTASAAAYLDSTSATNISECVADQAGAPSVSSATITSGDLSV